MPKGGGNQSRTHPVDRARGQTALVSVTPATPGERCAGPMVVMVETQASGQSPAIPLQETPSDTPGVDATVILDYNHGHTGDYWWLETQRGHSYRVEVKFGDNPDNNTGGSAWMSFIDPDHDDYPYASGCCEADHNRDDGHTFVHFYRPTDDWNNRYLVHIAAFDKLNSNSRTYNGPYTITMTDITGTRNFVNNLYEDTILNQPPGSQRRKTVLNMVPNRLQRRRLQT